MFRVHESGRFDMESANRPLAPLKIRRHAHKGNRGDGGEDCGPSYSDFNCIHRFWFVWFRVFFSDPSLAIFGHVWAAHFNVLLRSMRHPKLIPLKNCAQGRVTISGRAYAEINPVNLVAWNTSEPKGILADNDGRKLSPSPKGRGKLSLARGRALRPRERGIKVGDHRLPAHPQRDGTIDSIDPERGKEIPLGLST